MKAVYGDIYSIDELKKMSDDKEIIFRKIYKGNIKPIEGFPEFFFYLKSKKILVGLASNAIRKNVALTLNELGVHDLFDSIICGDEVNFGKPNPEMFDKTVSRFKLEKDNCIIFEDSIEGVGAAVNAGINVIGVTSSSPGDILNNAGCIKSISNYQKFNLSILEWYITKYLRAS